MKFSRLGAAALLACCAAAKGSPTVDAGTDRAGAVGVPLTLNGTVTGLLPTDFWVADGNTLPELANRVMQYNSNTGVTAVGPIRTAAGVVHGAPNDILIINGVYYGIDLNRRDLYTMDPATAIVTPIGSPWSYPNMGSLAYDSVNDILYGHDYNSHFVFTINRTTAATAPFIFLPLNDVHALEYVNGFFYCIDNATQAMYRFAPNPNNLQLTMLCSMPVNTAAGEVWDELVYYRGNFYGSFHTGGATTSQFGYVKKINTATGQLTQVGPPIANTNVHTLLINSLPEDVTWSVMSGPGTVSFANATSPQSSATFSAAGTYVLKLTVAASPSPISDTVTVTVYPNVDCNTNGTVDGLDIHALASRDCNTNSVPDECDTAALNAVIFASILVNQNGSPADNCFYDMNGDGLVDGQDVEIFVRRKLVP